MANEKRDKNPKESSQNGYSEEEVRKASSKAAKQATEAQNKATELMQAAAAAGDPEERQKLMEEALEQQIQSKSLGKTAKYLCSGTFQGMAAGAGLGIAPGASLGAITGTLVGGVSSTALGGLGAGVGAATGWMHGPFLDMGKGGGKIIQKVTGNLPGWKATESQKRQLEKMVGQINEQDAPSKEELEDLGNEGPSDDQKEVMDNVKSKMPSMPSRDSSDKPVQQEQPTEEKAKDNGSEKGQLKNETTAKTETRQSQNEEEKEEANDDKRETNRGRQCEDTGEKPEDTNTAGERPQETRTNYKDAAVQTGEEGRKKPRKLQSKSENGSAPSAVPAGTRKQPRKLEKRSA